MEIRNFWIAILSKRDSNEMMPSVVEIYGEASPMPGIAQAFKYERSLAEVDLTKSGSEIWNDQYNWVITKLRERFDI